MTVQNDRITVPAARPGKTALYQFLGNDGRLLYVGITGNPKKRWANHRRYAATTWWPLASHVTVSWHDTRDSAAVAELHIIRTKAPLYNSGGAPSPNRERVPGERLCPRLQYEKTRRELGARWSRLHTHEAIADKLAEDIRTGALPRGSAMPSGAALVNRFGVSIATVRRALGHLLEGGQIARRGEGSGTRYFVAE